MTLTFSLWCLVTASMNSQYTNICFLTLLVTLASNLDFSLAGFEHTCSPYQRPHPSGLCGPALIEVIPTLCTALGGSVYSKMRSKRDIDHVPEKMRGILLNKKDAMSYLTKREAGGHRSITCECCYNQCNIVELLQYCSLPSLFHRRSRAGSNNRNSHQNQLEDLS